MEIKIHCRTRRTKASKYIYFKITIFEKKGRKKKRPQELKL
jgi:hypothetical protein